MNEDIEAFIINGQSVKLIRWVSRSEQWKTTKPVHVKHRRGFWHC